MGVGVNFALQDLLRTLDRQDSHVSTQCFTCTLNFLCGVLLGLGKNSRLLGFSFATCLLNDGRSLLFGFDHARMVVVLGIGLDQIDACLRLCQIGLAFFGC